MSEGGNRWLGVAVAVAAVIVIGGGGLCLFGIFGLGVYQGFTRAVGGPPPPSDEDVVREELGVPARARLVSLDADPLTGGTFGREGLRIVATFDVPPEALASMEGAPGWQVGPLPDAVFAFPGPPRELPTPTNALAFCQIGTWRTGTSFDPHPCDPPLSDFDQYRAAVLDRDTGRLSVVLKNYY